MAFRPPTAHEKGDGSNPADRENRRQREQLRRAALLQQRRRRLLDVAAPIHLDLPSPVPELVKGTHGARGVTVGAAPPSYGITRPSSHALARRGGHGRERRLRRSKSHSRSPPPALAPWIAPRPCAAVAKSGLLCATVAVFLVVCLVSYEWVSQFSIQKRSGMRIQQEAYRITQGSETSTGSTSFSCTDSDPYDFVSGSVFLITSFQTTPLI